jgi:Beta-lactamase enzyme family
MRSSLSALALLAVLALALAAQPGDEATRAPAAVEHAFAAPPRPLQPGRPEPLAHRRDRKPQPRVPSAAALHDASRFARGRAGLVSFAVVNSDGKLRGKDSNRTYDSASTVKAMLLAAELRRLKRAGDGLDPETDSLLEAMITYSDNDAADAIYARVGDAGLYEVAERARMTKFSVAGYWSSADVTAADLARLFADLDAALVARFREYGKGLLGSVIPRQSWGIPEAAGDAWAVRFKGGWLPDRALVHQAAELSERDGPRRFSLAVLTDAQPSFTYGTDTIRGIAARLLAPQD